MGLVDRYGQFLINCQYQYLDDGNLKVGHWKVKRGNLVGIVNDKNELIIPIIYDEFYLSVQKLIASKNDKFGLINFEHEILIPFEYSQLSHLPVFIEEKLALVAQKNGTAGIINEQNQIIVPFEHEGIYALSYSLPKTYLAAQKNNLWG